MSFCSVGYQYTSLCIVHLRFRNRSSVLVGGRIEQRLNKVFDIILIGSIHALPNFHLFSESTRSWLHSGNRCRFYLHD